MPGPYVPPPGPRDLTQQYTAGGATSTVPGYPVGGGNPVAAADPMLLANLLMQRRRPYLRPGLRTQGTPPDVRARQEQERQQGKAGHGGRTSDRAGGGARNPEASAPAAGGFGGDQEMEPEWRQPDGSLAPVKAHGSIVTMVPKGTSRNYPQNFEKG